MKSPLLYPMVSYVFYIWLLGLLNFKTRFGAVRSGKMHPRFFKLFQGDAPPERVIVMGRHYDNQFQLPMLFLILCCAHLAAQSVNDLTAIIAWAFVATRLVHTFVHLGSNHVLKRAAAFAAGWVAVLALAIQLVINY